MQEMENHTKSMRRPDTCKVTDHNETNTAVERALAQVPTHEKPLSEFKFSQKVKAFLFSNNLATIADLEKHTHAQLLAKEHSSRKILAEIIEILSVNGFYLKSR